MRKKKILLSTLCLLFASCGRNNPPSSNPSSVPRHLNPITISKEELDIYQNTAYYGSNGILTFQEDGFTLQEGDTTKQYSYYNYLYNYNAPTIYAFGEDDTRYRVSLVNEEKAPNAKSEPNHYTLALEEQGKDGEYTQIASFMPSISAYSGYYSMTETADKYTLGFSFDGTYSDKVNAFLTSNGSSSSGHFDVNYRFISYYVLDKSENFQFQMELVDSDNDGYLTSHSVSVQKDRIVIGSNELYSGAGFLNGKFFSKQSGEVTLTLNDDNTAFSYGDHKDLALTAHVDEKGSYYTYTLDSVEYKLRATPYGFIKENGNDQEEFVYDEKEQLNGLTYQYQEKGYTFSYTQGYNEDFSLKETVTLNGKEVPFSLDIYKHHLAIKVIDGKDTYYFTQYFYGRAILVSVNGTETFFLNTDFYQETFARTFYAKSKNSTLTFSIDDDFKVTMDGKTARGYLTYDGKQSYVTLHFTLDNQNYTLDVYYLNNLVFVLRNGTQESYCFDKNVVDSFYGDFTSDGTKNLSLTDKNLKLGTSTYDYELAPYYYAYGFSYMIGLKATVDGVEHTYILNGASDIWEIEDQTVTKDYIPYEQYQKLLGVYTFQSRYGEERLYVEQGKFYADTADGDNLRKKVEYPFVLSMNLNTLTNQAEPVISFLVSGVYLMCYLKGGSLALFGSKYVKDEIFQANGVYLSEDKTTAYYLHDDVLEVNGTQQTITDYSYGENGSFTVKTASATYTFTKDGDNYKVSDGTAALTRQAIDYDSFVNTYEATDEGTKYTFEFVKKTDATTGHITYVGKVNNFEYSYTWTIQAGKLAMKFATGSYTYYLSLEDDGSLTLSRVGGLLPPPPPPIF